MSSCYKLEDNMTDTEKIKEGPKWTNDRLFSLHLEALERIEKLKVEWSNKKAPNMQTKVRRRADGRFQVKYRKEPVLNEKETKDGNRNRKNKRTTSSPKFNADAGI